MYKNIYSCDLHLNSIIKIKDIQYVRQTSISKIVECDQNVKETKQAKH